MGGWSWRPLLEFCKTFLYSVSPSLGIILVLMLESEIGFVFRLHSLCDFFVSTKLGNTLFGSETGAPFYSK